MKIWLVDALLLPRESTSKGVSKVFWLVFYQIQYFSDKSHLYSSFKFLVYRKFQGCSHLRFDFCTLYIKLPHFDLISKLNNMIVFAFLWKSKNTFFYEKFLTTVEHLIKCVYFQVWNLNVFHTISISMCIGLTSFWAKLKNPSLKNLSKNECDFRNKLIEKEIARAKKLFIDDRWAPLMMESNFKSPTKNFTSRNWY